MYDTVYDYKIKPYSGEFTNSRYFSTEFVSSMAPFSISDTLAEGYQLYSLLSFKDPAINGGTPDTTGLGLPEFDLLGQKRIYGTTIDIGAIEFNDSLLTRVFFSPIRKPQLFNFDHCDMVVFSLRGQKLASFKAMVTPRSIQQFVGNKFSQGMYIVTLKSSGGQVWSKNVLVK